MVVAAAAITAAATIGTAAMSASAAKSAANKQADAAENAADAQLLATREQIASQEKMYEQQRQDIEPWRQAGGTALGYMTPGLRPGGEFNRNFTMQDFQQDPGYAFRLREGLKAINSSAAARGGALGGGIMRGLTRYGQEQGANEYQNAWNRWNTGLTNRWNRLSGVAGIGQTANNTLASLGQNTANQISDAIGAGGQARASGYLGAANAQAAGQVGAANSWNSAIGGLTNTFNNFAMSRPQFGGATSAPIYNPSSPPPMPSSMMDYGAGVTYAPASTGVNYWG
jgi:hypothetical protein